MRITGGRFGGRVLKAPASRAIRPSADRVREALFNALVHRAENPLDGADVIDLFAGTGALGVARVTRVFRRDATRLGEAPEPGRFRVAFLDPPYGHDLAPAGLRALR